MQAGFVRKKKRKEGRVEEEKHRGRKGKCDSQKEGRSVGTKQEINEQVN